MPGSNPFRSASKGSSPGDQQMMDDCRNCNDRAEAVEDRPCASRLNGPLRQRRSVPCSPVYDRIRELRTDLAATSCARERAQAEEELKSLIAEQAKFDYAFDVAEKHLDVVIQVGPTGLPGTPRSVTATMFTPCSNISSAARHVAQFVELCSASTRSKGDPNHCAIAAWHGSWERPDNGFADRVLVLAAKGEHLMRRCRAGTGIDDAEVSSSRHPTSRNTTPATAPSPTPHDDQRARRSPLFAVMAKPSDGAPIECPASDRTAVGEQKSDCSNAPFDCHSAARRQRVHVHVRATFGAPIRAEIGMTKLRRGVR
jgi:hypothetical protein